MIVKTVKRTTKKLNLSSAAASVSFKSFATVAETLPQRFLL